MRPSRRPLLALSFLLLSALFVVAAPAALAKGKQPEVDPIELRFDADYMNPEATARAKAVDALRAAPDPLRFSILSRKAIPIEQRADVVAHIVEILSRITDEKVIAEIAKAAMAGPTEQRVIYIESLASMPSSTAAHQALLALVKDKDHYVRGMAAYGLGEHRAMDAFDPLVALLEDRMWQVQAAALAALPRLSDKEKLKSLVPQLVDFLENCSGRMRTDVSETLRKLTGRNLGREPDAWRKFLAGGAPEPAPAGDAAEEPGKPEVPYANQETKPHFYGIEVVSNRVLLILDVSLSMYDEIDIDKDRLRRETSRRRTETGGAATGEKGDKKDKDGKDPKADAADIGYDIEWWKIKTRLDLAKAQTRNLVSQLRDDQWFEIITFSTEVKPWMGKLVPATSVNKQKAIAMLDAIVPEDKTNTWGALAATFEMMDIQKKGQNEGPDEAYLVTDGAPSIGDIVDSQQILEATLQLQRMKPIRINVIGIGVDLSFLRKMAQSTGGVSKFFKGKQQE